jgi:hypothetical protein
MKYIKGTFVYMQDGSSFSLEKMVRVEKGCIVNDHYGNNYIVTGFNEVSLTAREATPWEVLFAKTELYEERNTESILEYKNGFFNVIVSKKSLDVIITKEVSSKVTILPICRSEVLGIAELIKHLEKEGIKAIQEKAIFKVGDKVKYFATEYEVAGIDLDATFNQDQKIYYDLKVLSSHFENPPTKVSEKNLLEEQDK